MLHDSIRLLGIIENDFVNYKKVSLTLEFPFCSFKCTLEDQNSVCQNMHLSKIVPIAVPIIKIIELYDKDPISESIVCQGLEPFDSFDELLNFIRVFRLYSLDDIVIYTGYEYPEIKDRIQALKEEYFENIIIKLGRYRSGDTPHYDDLLGVKLSSNNQYAKKLEYF